MAATESYRTEVSPYFNNLPPGWQIVREVDCICDYDYYNTGEGNRANGCGGVYYRRISISQSGMVHNERTKCKCVEEYSHIERQQNAIKTQADFIYRINSDIDRLFKGRNLVEDDIHSKMSLNNFSAEHPTQKAALDKVSNFRAGTTGLCFYGPAGRGKTHLAVALAKKLKNEGKTCLAIKSIDLLNRIKKTYNRDDVDEVEVMGILKNIDVLVIDDIGTERPTGWVLEKLYEIIDYRTRRKTTIFTTNLGGEELIKKLGEALVSRIYGVGEQVEVDGKDRRVVQDTWLDYGTEVKRGERMSG